MDDWTLGEDRTLVPHCGNTVGDPTPTEPNQSVPTLGLVISSLHF